MKLPRFKLRTLFVLIGVIAVYLGLVLPELRERERTRLAQAHQAAVDGYRFQRNAIEQQLRGKTPDKAIEQVVQTLDANWRKDWNESPPAFP